MEGMLYCETSPFQSANLCELKVQEFGTKVAPYIWLFTELHSGLYLKMLRGCKYWNVKCKYLIARTCAQFSVYLLHYDNLLISHHHYVFPWSALMDSATPDFMLSHTTLIAGPLARSLTLYRYIKTR